MSFRLSDDLVADPALIAPTARAECNARIKVMRPPAAGFDPLTATDDELLDAGLPRRPDDRLYPDLHAQWRRLVLPLPREMPATGWELLLGAAGNTPEDASAMRGGRWGSSRNWSGALIAARDNCRFQAMVAVWTVPSPGLPPGASLASPPVNGSWRASFWIGLDGHRLASRSLPQLGTTILIEAVNGAPVLSAYAWAQWWVRDHRFGEVKISNFPLDFGDTVIAWLEVVSPTEVQFNMRNLTKDTPTRGIRWTAGEVPEDPAGGDRSIAPVEGSAACWIAERPLSMPPPLATVADVLYPLPAFDVANAPADPQPVTMDVCLALMREQDDPTRPAVLRDLTCARKLRMMEAMDDQPGTRRLIQPGGRGLRTSFSYVPR